MIDVALLGDFEYNSSIPPGSESELLICSWTHLNNNNLMVVLMVNRIAMFNIKSVDLYASDTSSDVPPLRIGINNGIQEILDAIDRKAPDLIHIIKLHNPDIEELLSRHPCFEKEDIQRDVVPGIALSVSTQKRL